MNNEDQKKLSELVQISIFVCIVWALRSHAWSVCLTSEMEEHNYEDDAMFQDRIVDRVFFIKQRFFSHQTQCSLTFS